ncbi:MAG: T9SS type A sorting domain-containing protein, partial [Bacteroidota bacterium]
FVARSDDGGRSWTEVLSAYDGAYGLAYPIYARVLAVDASPVGGAGAVEVWASVASTAGPPPNPGVLLRSRDAGATWERAEGTGGYDGEWPNEMALDRLGRLYLATGLGLWRTVEPVGRPWPVASEDSTPPGSTGELGLTVAPNPSSGSISVCVEGRANGPLRMAIYDTQGRRVHVGADLRAGGCTLLPNLTDLAAGTYVVEAVSTHSGVTVSAPLTVAR